MYMCVCTCMVYILSIFSEFIYVLYIVYVHLNQNFRVRKEKKFLKINKNFTTLNHFSQINDHSGYPGGNGLWK